MNNLSLFSGNFLDDRAAVFIAEGIMVRINMEKNSNESQPL